LIPVARVEPRRANEVHSRAQRQTKSVATTAPLQVERIPHVLQSRRALLKITRSQVRSPSHQRVANIFFGLGTRHVAAPRPKRLMTRETTLAMACGEEAPPS
jgi:hypothetical protein